MHVNKKFLEVFRIFTCFLKEAIELHDVRSECVVAAVTVCRGSINYILILYSVSILAFDDLEITRLRVCLLVCLLSTYIVTKAYTLLLIENG